MLLACQWAEVRDAANRPTSHRTALSHWGSTPPSCAGMREGKALSRATLKVNTKDCGQEPCRLHPLCDIQIPPF